MTAQKITLADLQAAAPGLEYSAKFVPQSASRNAAEKMPSLNWKVTFTRNGRTLTTDYGQGSGWAPAYKASVKEMGGHDSILRNAAIRHECERGTVAKIVADSIFAGKPLTAPDAADVMQSLLMDGEAIGETFTDWATDLGYDTDSRKAEAIYLACVKIGRELASMFTPAELDALRELTKDM